MAAAAPTELDGAEISCTVLLDVVETCCHSSASEWIFLRELRVGTGFQNARRSASMPLR